MLNVNVVRVNTVHVLVAGLGLGTPTGVSKKTQQKIVTLTRREKSAGTKEVIWLGRQILAP
jgi:hypothetical protein